jgi:glycosyltransferase involved in cell wall biosynthesis
MITILSLKSPSGKATDAVDTVNRNVFNKININDINFVETKGFFNKIILMHKLKPDFLLGIGNIEEIFFVLSKPSSVRYVIAWHTLLRKTKTWLIRKFLFNSVEFIITVSCCAGVTVKNLFPNIKVFTALNGVDTDFFNKNRENKDYLSKKYSISFNKPVVLFVGALFKRKRPDIFISIARKFNDATFILIGREDKEDFLSDTKNIHNFKWIPFMDRNDIATMMASSDIFLFPSINEPCAAVIPEAMSSGLIVLLSKSCGNRELIDDGKNGFLVDVGDNEVIDFLDHLKNIFSNDNFRKNISQNARKKCEDQLNWPAVSGVYKKIFYENL